MTRSYIRCQHCGKEVSPWRPVSEQPPALTRILVEDDVMISVAMFTGFKPVLTDDGVKMVPATLPEEGYETCPGKYPIKPKQWMEIPRSHLD